MQHVYADFASGNYGIPITQLCLLASRD